jgi:hypothetical protein
MLGFKILKEYENLYENDLKEQIPFLILISVLKTSFYVFLLFLSEFEGFGCQSCLSAVNLNILHLLNFNILSPRQQVGLKSKVCKYCKQKVTGDLDYRSEPL